MTTLEPTGYPHRLTPERVRTTKFTRTPLGRRGYNEEEVELFLNRMAKELSASDTEKANLRAEIDRVKNTFKDWQSQTYSQGTVPVRTGPSVEAINLLSQAQQQADAHVAQAQEFCRRLAMHARDQANEVMREAQRRAEYAAEQAAQEYRTNTGARHTEEIEEMERRIAWLQTFVHAVQIQLTAASDAFAREVSRLTELPTISQNYQDQGYQGGQTYPDRNQGYPAGQAQTQTQRVLVDQNRVSPLGRSGSHS